MEFDARQDNQQDITWEEILLLHNSALKEIGTKLEIQKLVLKLAEEGMSITFISSEIEEMLRPCSRLIVMRDSKIVGQLTGDEMTQEHVMHTIAGGQS